MNRNQIYKVLVTFAYHGLSCQSMQILYLNKVTQFLDKITSLLYNKLVNNVYNWTNYKMNVQLPNQFIELVGQFWSISAFMQDEDITRRDNTILLCAYVTNDKERTCTMIIKNINMQHQLLQGNSRKIVSFQTIVLINNICCQETIQNRIFIIVCLMPQLIGKNVCYPSIVIGEHL